MSKIVSAAYRSQGRVSSTQIFFSYHCTGHWNCQKGTHRSTSAFSLCPKKGQILHDSCSWPANTSLSSPGTQQIKLDNCSKSTLICHSTYHAAMSLDQVKCCILTRPFVLMRGWSLGMRLPGHCTEANLY